MIFHNRLHAARLLVDKLDQYRSQHPLVLAIPRGGVPIGRVIADALGGELDVLMVRKLSAPGDPELAIGAVSESGEVFISTIAERLGANEAYIDAQVGQQMSLMHRRRAQYTPIRSPISPKDRIVIAVDDGLATGATMLTGLRSLQNLRPKKVICALPVAAADSVALIAQYCDEIVCLSEEQYFSGVGAFYEDFAQVDDGEVINLLAGA